jgi:hypothetical protein
MAQHRFRVVVGIVLVVVVVSFVGLSDALEACSIPNDCQGVTGYPYCLDGQCRQCNPQRFVGNVGIWQCGKGA